MFIQDFYLGLDGKQRVVVLSAVGAFGCLLFCCVVWTFSGGQTTAMLSDQEIIAITSGKVDADRSQKTFAAASLAAPTPKQTEIVRAGLAKSSRPSFTSMQSKSRSQ